jgi:hypothetical protein
MGRYIGELKKLDVKNNASRFSIEVLNFDDRLEIDVYCFDVLFVYLRFSHQKYHYQQNIIFKYFAKEDWCL